MTSRAINNSLTCHICKSLVFWTVEIEDAIDRLNGVLTRQNYPIKRITGSTLRSNLIEMLSMVPQLKHFFDIKNDGHHPLNFCQNICHNYAILRYRTFCCQILHKSLKRFNSKIIVSMSNMVATSILVSVQMSYLSPQFDTILQSVVLEIARTVQKSEHFFIFNMATDAMSVFVTSRIRHR